jgi:release factor glutamine methyltransferase
VTIHEQVAAARTRLRAACIPDAEADLDARLLAEHLLGWDAARYFTDGGEPAPPEFQTQYDALIARRAAREPVAYIVGRQEFWGLAFAVSPAVLVPRPETELIVEAALELFPSADAPLRIADICTGSGCLAVALARERPRGSVLATDLSYAALAVARDNAMRHHVADRIEFRHADLLAGIDRRFDLIVANPPYVLDRERSMLQPEVRDHEPGMALFGGPDGLELIRRLVPSAADRLDPGGALVFEFGFGQDEAIEQLISSTAGLTIVALRCDLQGIPRTAVARKA